MDNATRFDIAFMPTELLATLHSRFIAVESLADRLETLLDELEVAQRIGMIEPPSVLVDSRETYETEAHND